MIPGSSLQLSLGSIPGSSLQLSLGSSPGSSLQLSLGSSPGLIPGFGVSLSHYQLTPQYSALGSI